MLKPDPIRADIEHRECIAEWERRRKNGQTMFTQHGVDSHTPLPGTTTTDLQLPDGTTLHIGDTFRTPQEPGQVFTFKGLITRPDGYQYIDAFGGDRKPTGNRKFRAFPPNLPVKKLTTKQRGPMSKTPNRQGDVLLVRTTKTKNMSEQEKVTVAYGEVTGHHHSIITIDKASKEVIDAAEAVVAEYELLNHVELTGMRDVINRARAGEKSKLLASPDGKEFKLIGGGFIIHEAHGNPLGGDHMPQPIVAGTYEALIHQEYSDEGFRAVID